MRKGREGRFAKRLISLDSVKPPSVGGYRALYSVSTSAGHMTINGWISRVSGGDVIDLDSRRTGGASVSRALSRASRLSTCDFKEGSTGAVCFLGLKYYEHCECLGLRTINLQFCPHNIVGYFRHSGD